MAAEQPKLSMISPAERAEAQRQQEAIIRAALGKQYPAWLKLKQATSKNVKKMDS